MVRSLVIHLSQLYCALGRTHCGHQTLVRGSPCSVGCWQGSDDDDDDDDDDRPAKRRCIVYPKTIFQQYRNDFSIWLLYNAIYVCNMLV